MSIYTEKFMDDGIEYYNPQPSINSRKTKKILSDPTKHYPNKDEAQELRKIMASTGLTEKEVREDKKYRKQLSDAQKAGQKAKRGVATKWYQLQIKKACRQTKLAPQHPETLKALDEILKDANPRWLRHSLWMFGGNHIMSAEKAVKIYGK
jgi:hypothetical protein